MRLTAGTYGPEPKMKTAIAAPTPNVPWARWGCSDIIDFDGQGTSAATPQGAAAAALWLQRNRAAVDAYPKGWMRVEAIRSALFGSAKENAQESKRLGRGELRAHEALAQAPSAASALQETDADDASFEFLRILTGRGLQASPEPQQQMLELEALQLSQSAAAENGMPADAATASHAEVRGYGQARDGQPPAHKALAAV